MGLSGCPQGIGATEGGGSWGQGGQYPHGAQCPAQAPSPCQGLPLTPLLGGRPGILGSHRLSPGGAVCMVAALQNPCESSGTGGVRVHVGSGALTLSWENSSLISSLPCFADGGAKVSEGPSSRPSCLCGTGCRAEPGSLLVAWLSCWGSSGHRGCCRPCRPLCSQPPGPLVSQERAQCWLCRLDSHVRGKVSGFLALSATRGQRTRYLGSVSPGIYLLDPQTQSRQEEP